MFFFLATTHAPHGSLPPIYLATRCYIASARASNPSGIRDATVAAITGQRRETTIKQHITTVLSCSAFIVDRYTRRAGPPGRGRPPRHQSLSAHFPCTCASRRRCGARPAARVVRRATWYTYRRDPVARRKTVEKRKSVVSITKQTISVCQRRAEVVIFRV